MSCTSLSVTQCHTCHSMSHITCHWQSCVSVTHVIQYHMSLSYQCYRMSHISKSLNVTVSHRSLSVNLMSPTHNVTECHITQCHHSTSPSVTQSQIALNITYITQCHCHIVSYISVTHCISCHNITQCHTSSHCQCHTLSQCQCPTVPYIPHRHTVSHIVTPRCHTKCHNTVTMSFSSYIIQCHSVNVI